MTNPKEELPSHTPFTKRGEGHGGKEAGRETGTRTARDATGINPRDEDPIDPAMPYLPPA
jgi:hypothetical protein